MEETLIAQLLTACSNSGPPRSRNKFARKRGERKVPVKKAPILISELKV